MSVFSSAFLGGFILVYRLKIFKINIATVIQVAVNTEYSNKLLLNMESGSVAALGLSRLEKYANGFSIPPYDVEFCFICRLLLLGDEVTPNF